MFYLPIEFHPFTQDTTYLYRSIGAYITKKHDLGLNNTNKQKIIYFKMFYIYFGIK